MGGFYVCARCPRQLPIGIRSDSSHKERHPEDESVAFYFIDSYHLEASEVNTERPPPSGDVRCVDVTTSAPPSTSAVAPSVTFKFPAVPATRPIFLDDPVPSAVCAPFASYALQLGVVGSITHRSALPLGLQSLVNDILGSETDFDPCCASMEQETIQVLATLLGLCGPFPAGRPLFVFRRLSSRCCSDAL